MNRLSIFGAILILATAAAAQMHGPPASVTSFRSGPTFSQSPGVAASVTSFGRAGFGGPCCGVGVGGGFGFGHNPRVFAGVGTFRPRVIAVPVYVPSYYAYPAVSVYPAYPAYPYPAYPVAYDGYSPYTVERGTQPVMEDRTVVYEPARSSARSDDERYGEHYLDGQGTEDRTAPSREQARSATPPAVAPRESIEPATVLILKTGERVEVHNYAIVGDTVWVLSDRAARKIALSDLDVAKTTKENDARGLGFKLPRHD